MAAKYMAEKYVREIIGTENWEFIGRDGKPVSGMSIYTSQKIPPERGTGQRTDKITISRAKLADVSFNPRVGQIIQPLYTETGKLATILLVEDTEFDTGFDE